MDEDEIIAFIRDKYGSLESPNFSFVEDAISRQPYQALIRRLSRVFSVEEDTDPNDDVSFMYVLTSGRRQWLLRMSMLGPYAVLFRLNDEDEPELVWDDWQATSDSEKEALGILSDMGIRVMSLEELSLRVPLTLFNADPGNVRVYQALFTDTDVLPWEGSF